MIEMQINLHVLWKKKISMRSLVETHWGLMTPYGDRDLVNIGWTNVDLPSVRSIGIHLSTILQEILQPPITKISWKIAFLKFLEISQGPMS